MGPAKSIFPVSLIIIVKIVTIISKNSLGVDFRVLLSTIMYQSYCVNSSIRASRASSLTALADDREVLGGPNLDARDLQRNNIICI